MNFSAKVTARNILRYKKRFFMTIAGISGCMAILITGFGLRDSIRMVAVKQFDDIYQYDVLITVAEGGADRASLERHLMSLGEIEGWQYQRRENADVRMGRAGTAYETTLVVPDEAGLLGDFVTRKERRTGRPVLPSDNGVVITQKLALLLGASVGDEITMINEDDEEWAAAVAGVAENYVGHYVYMTPAYYAGITGARLKYTTIVGKTQDMSEARREEISESLLENKGVVALSFNAKVRDFYTDLLDALNIVVFVLIACGALLSFVVLTCLTGVNIDERKREIATLKVLGFYDGEAASYIFRENMVNTVVGSAAGMGLGVLLHQYIIRTVELDMIVFGKVVSPMSFAYATALTFLFTFAVNLAMSGDIRNIDMIESLKSVE
jgi:putative ABC transport system permease protein